MKPRLLVTLFAALCLPLLAEARQGAAHPSLVITASEAASIRESSGMPSLFASSLEEMLEEADSALAREINVPVPKDGGGGYTHEVHKRNYYDMYNCGLAWQMTGKPEYARRVREMLLSYADLYPRLGYHPMTLSPVRGRLFWQTLNECVWLVHTAIAYDCVYDSIPASERKVIERDLFRPMAKFIMEGTPDNRANLETFNKMHNHGTWSQAAVGMIGMVMGDDDMVDKALYGSKEGGGFIRQLDVLFSPDGYFTEGAYYQRYALWPFMLFAQAIGNNRPSLDIFGYRDGILLKSVDALLNLAYDGEFFHYNDALAKGYDAQELVCAVDIAYNARPEDTQLLDVARRWQGRVSISEAGYRVAADIDAGKATPLRLHSALYRDGADGREGGFAVLRTGGGSALTFKATSHGLSHGHYDKLTLAWYDSGHEVVSDYGAARFVNIEAKYGGHYTPENKTYAMTTVAHNTLVADGRSHYGGDIKESSRHAPRMLAYSDADPAMQYVAALDSCAIPGVRISRWLALAEVPFVEGPLVLDLLKAESSEEHVYDLPVHYNGQMISLSVPYTRSLAEMRPLGDEPGYRHLWVEATARGAEGSTSYTWLCGSKLYSLTSATGPDTEIYLLRTGAGDPDFNLRSEPAVMLRERGARSRLFASCLESHGKYDLRYAETASGMERSCTGVEVIRDDPAGMEVRYSFKGGHSLTVAVDLQDNTMTIRY